MSDNIHVVLVDDHPLFREGVAHILRAEPDIEIVGQGATADDALRLACTLLPDLILLDISLPGGGLQAAQLIAGACPVTRIVMLTVSEQEDHVLTALKGGARAYILKGVPARELVSIVRAVYAGQSYVTPALAAGLLAEMRPPVTSGARALSPLDELTVREQQILEGLAGGLSNREIGAQLHLAEKTVKHYMTNILQKLQVRNRVEAALLVARSEKPGGRQ